MMAGQAAFQGCLQKLRAAYKTLFTFKKGVKRNIYPSWKWSCGPEEVKLVSGWKASLSMELIYMIHNYSCL